MFTLESFSDVKPVVSETMIFSRVMCPYQAQLFPICSSCRGYAPERRRKERQTHCPANSMALPACPPQGLYISQKRALSLSIIKNFWKLIVGKWQKHPVVRCLMCSSFYLQQWWNPHFSSVTFQALFIFLPSSSPFPPSHIMARFQPIGLLKKVTKATAIYWLSPSDCPGVRQLALCLRKLSLGIADTAGHLARTQKPHVSYSLGGSIFQLWESRSGERECEEDLFVWILANLIVAQVFKKDKSLKKNPWGMNQL